MEEYGFIVGDSAVEESSVVVIEEGQTEEDPVGEVEDSNEVEGSVVIVEDSACEVGDAEAVSVGREGSTERVVHSVVDIVDESDSSSLVDEDSGSLVKKEDPASLVKDDSVVEDPGPVIEDGPTSEGEEDPFIFIAEEDSFL